MDTGQPGDRAETTLEPSACSRGALRAVSLLPVPFQHRSRERFGFAKAARCTSINFNFTTRVALFEQKHRFRFNVFPIVPTYRSNLPFSFFLSFFLSFAVLLAAHREEETRSERSRDGTGSPRKRAYDGFFNLTPCRDYTWKRSTMAHCPGTSVGFNHGCTRLCQFP